MPITSVRGLLRPTPTLHESRHTGQPPFKPVHGRTGRGFRVGVVDSLGGSFAGGATAVDRSFRYTANAPSTVVRMRVS